MTNHWVDKREVMKCQSDAIFIFQLSHKPSNHDVGWCNVGFTNVQSTRESAWNNPNKLNRKLKRSVQDDGIIAESEGFFHISISLLFFCYRLTSRHFSVMLG